MIPRRMRAAVKTCFILFGGSGNSPSVGSARAQGKAQNLPTAGQSDGAGEGEGDEVEHHDAVDDEECFHRLRDGAGSGGFELEQGSCCDVEIVER